MSTRPLGYSQMVGDACSRESTPAIAYVPASPSSPRGRRSSVANNASNANMSASIIDMAALQEGLKEDDAKDHPLARFVIRPGSEGGTWGLEVWDTYLSAVVLFIAFYEPYTMALYSVGNEPLICTMINHILSLSFGMDMLLQFVIAIPRAEDSLHKDLWERNPNTLARRYCGIPCSEHGMGGWFWLDFLSISPSIFGSVLPSGDSTANPLLMLRIIRLFQTMRITRMAKLGRMLHTRYGFPLYLVEIVKLSFITTLTCHLMACTWVLFEGKETRGLISYQTRNESWLSALIEAKGDSCTPNVAQDKGCVYILAFYWATMTLTGVGYGDITPQNRMEYCISAVCMTVVGYTWAYIVGSIVSTISSIDKSATVFAQRLDELSELSRRRGLPHALKVRLRGYMHETRHFTMLSEQRRLVEMCLSDGLQREVAARSAEVTCIVKGVFWMRDLEEDAILDIVRLLKSYAYGQYEVLNLPDTMFLIQKGIVGVRGRVLARGDIWGHAEILIESPHLKDTSMPRTISFVEMLVLTKKSLLEICKRYPKVDRRLRRAQIRTAVFRGFCFAAQREKTKKILVRSGVPLDDVDHDHISPGQASANRGSYKRYRGGSFLNLGARALGGVSEGEMVRTDLPELKRLINLVLARQDAIEDQLDSLEEHVKQPESPWVLTAKMRKGLGRFTNKGRKSSQSALSQSALSQRSSEDGHW